MRIAYFSDNFYPEISGIADSIVTTGSELARRGHEVLFVAPRYPAGAFARLGLENREADFGPRTGVVRLPAVPLPGSPTGMSRVAVPCGTSLRVLKKFGPDVLHAQMQYSTGLEALLASRVLGKPLVGTNHTPTRIFVEYYSPIRAGWFYEANLAYATWFYNRCRFVTSPSQSVFDEMRGFDRKIPHAVLSNPIRIGSFKPAGAAEKKAAKKKLGLSAHALLYAGRIAAEKRIDFMIKALPEIARRVPDAEAAIVGRGPAENGLKKLAEGLGVARRVKFLGFVEEEKLPLVYRASDVFIMVSKAESQSIVAMQAMASGIPVVGAPYWGLKDYVPRGGVMIEDDTPEGLAEAAASLLLDGRRRLAIGKKGRKFAETCSVGAVAGRWEEIYGKASSRR